MKNSTDIAIIGAGPSGTIAAALLRQYGYDVTIIEHAIFPRFSIGESLLPQCMVYVEQAGMTEAVMAAGFQYKNGAAFARGEEYTFFDFRNKFSEGPGTTMQVQRADFDQILATKAAEAGAEVRFGETITGLDYSENNSSLLHISDRDGARRDLECRFVLDASGFGRVLPRLLDLELPSTQPPRVSLFSHIQDNIQSSSYDRDKILITVHPRNKGVWYWLIPFSNGRSSLGVIGTEGYFDLNRPHEELLKEAIKDCPELSQLLENAVFDTPVNCLSGYACNVKTLWGKNFALLGNAGEFLDPIFSSGVTIAMKSASLAAPLVHKQLSGNSVDWESEYAKPLRLGVDTFRTFVDAWYDGSFQDVVFAKNQAPKIRAMIASILAGYAWDIDNPFVKESRRRLTALAAICQ